MKRIVNYRLYFFELLTACLVIFIHAFKNSESYILDSLGRVTVLFFFILSSYFYNQTINKEGYRYIETIKRCLKLLLIVTVGIIVYGGVVILLNINDLSQIELFSHFSIANIGNFIAKYELVFIWYIFALIILYLIYPFINKIKWLHRNKHPIKLGVTILILVYLYRIFATKYNFMIGSFSLSRIEITRNFFFTGLPCFLIGTCIYDNINNAKKIESHHFNIIFITLTITMMLEACMHKIIGIKENEFYISSIFLAIILVVYSLQNPESKVGETLYRLFGKRGPTFIYLFHVLFLMIYRNLFTFENSLYVVIPLSILTTLTIAFIYNLIRKSIKKPVKMA